MSPGVILKRLGIGLLLTVVLLCVLLLATLAYFSATTSGLQQLIGLGQRWLPGELQVEHVEGRLLDRFSLRGIRFTHPDIDLTLQRLALDWQPQTLLSGRLQLSSLEVDQPVIRVTAVAEPARESEETEPVFPISLPEITLPLQLRIDRVALTDLILHPAPVDDTPAAPVQISRAMLQLHTEQQVVVIDQLMVETPEGQVTLAGQVETRDAFPLQLTTDWQMTLPDYPVLDGEGRISGDLNALTIEQQLSGLLDARIAASLQQLLVQPQGEIKIEALQADLGLASAELQGHAVRGNLSASGNLQQLELLGQLQATLPEVGDSALQLRIQLFESALKIEQFHFTQANTQAALQLGGTLNWQHDSPQFELQGDWQNLQYPLQGADEYHSAAGQVQIAGTTQQYQLTLNAALAGAAIPSGHWTLTGTGSEQGLKPFTLRGETLDGSLQGTGWAEWQPDLRWQVELEGRQLNPGLQWADWPGRLDFHATSSGVQADEQPLQLSVVLDALEGTLRDEPLKGQADVSLVGTELSIPQLQLTVAGADLNARGSLGEKLDMDWALNAPDLANLLPNARGTLNGTGTLRGPLEQLNLAARLQGQELQIDAHQMGSVDADLRVDLSGQEHSHIRLTATQLNLAGNRWQQLTLTGEGTPNQHQLALNLGEGAADLRLDLNGSWDNTQWRGTLTRAELEQHQLGAWQLQRPTPLVASAEAASINRLCLQRAPANSGELCVTGSWSAADGVQGELQARKLSLAALEPWLPPGTQAQGQLQADATFSQPLNQRPQFAATAQLDGAELLLEEENLTLVGGDIRLSLKGQNERLTADLQLPLQQPVGDVRAQLKVDDLYDARTLNGSLVMNLSELNFISLFTPQLQAISGRVESALRVRGSADKPRVEGNLKLLDASAELPALGIKLESINLTLTDQPDSSALKLEGGLTSGDGRLALSGEFDPLTTTGQLSLDGERFQAAATQEIQAWISPAIKVNVAPQKITLRGEIKIPEAYITPPKIDALSPISPDVVILDESTAGAGVDAAPRQVLDASLRFTLGDKVEVDALGFKGRLEGSVLVEDDGRRATRATGSMQVATGQYRLYGQDLNIDRGSLLFTGGPVDNPGLDLRVSRKVDEVVAGAKVSGTLREPRLNLFSEPAMPESSLLSYLLFGRAPGAQSNTPSEQELLLRAASALTMKGGNVIADRLSEALNLDDLGIEGGNAVSETSLYIGKYLSPRLYVKYGVGLLEPTNTFFMRYQLSKRWSLETQSGTEGSGGDVIYTLER